MASFLEERKEYLLRLEYLIGRGQSVSGLKAFSRDELYELGRLYRRLSGDLAKAQTIGADPDTLAYLNSLLAQGHNVVYRGESNPINSVISFVTSVFPRAFRRNFGPIFVATLILFLPSVWSYFVYQASPEWREVLVPPNVSSQFESSLDESGPSMLAAAIEEDKMALSSTYIILNNIQVSIIAFGGGMIFGLLTIWVLFSNGLILGGIASIFTSHGPEYSLYFYSGILPHGVLELPAIAISGGAGLLLGKALIAPGRLRRIDALKRNGKEAAFLMMGVAIILGFAGLIEGFVTPIKIGGSANVPALMYAKIAFSILLFILFLTYLILAGKRHDERAFDFVRDGFGKVSKYTPGGIFRVLRSAEQEI